MTPGKLWTRNSQDIFDHQRRVTWSEDASTSIGSRIVPWEIAGVVAVGNSFDFPFGPGDAYNLDWFWAKLHVAVGTTSTVLSLLRNGVSVATLTIPSSTAIASVALSPVEPFVNGDLYSVAVTTAGTGASGLQTVGRFQPQ